MENANLFLILMIIGIFFGFWWIVWIVYLVVRPRKLESAGATVPDLAPPPSEPPAYETKKPPEGEE